MLADWHDRLIARYLHAKDLCRTHLFASVFTPDARFQTRFAFQTDFNDEEPDLGIDAIIKTFQKLGAFCENMYTVCTRDSLHVEGDTMRSKWIVCMQERHSRRERAAWGEYLWTFDAATERAASLLVTMQHMAELEPQHAPAVIEWISAVPDPWCTAAELLAKVPPLEPLAPLREYFTPNPADR